MSSINFVPWIANEGMVYENAVFPYFLTSFVGAHAVLQLKLFAYPLNI